LFRTVLVAAAMCRITPLAAQPPAPPAARFDDIKLRADVKKAIDRGVRFLEAQQKQDGSWRGGLSTANYEIGVTSLAIIALINSDVPVNSPVIQNGLNFLRGLDLEETRRRHAVYEFSLAIMALSAAEELERDLPRIAQWAQLLEQAQVVDGTNRGSWWYSLHGLKGGNADRSNAQYAVLGLREAAYAGVPIARETWQLAHEHWVNGQSANGGWSYSEGDGSVRGSMTVAGLSTLAITSRMLQDDSDVDAQGRPDCCGVPQPLPALQNGRRWMAENFRVASNPGYGLWHYYYLYGLERAGRMMGVRYFGRHDWYRQGAEYFVEAQLPAGNWISTANETDPISNTSMALIFLSKGLSRVVVNKLDYNSPNGEIDDAGEWNRHPYDVTSLIELIDGLPTWPPRLTNQVVTLSRLKPETAVEELNQAPVLFLSGREAPQLTDQQVTWLRNYVETGGFIFACSNCDGRGFDDGFRSIVTRMFPDGEASLAKLPADHAVFRSEYLLDSSAVELWGVDFGCRTSIIYSPDDLGCLWQKWMKHEPPGRNPALSQRVMRSTRIGVNVLAYATGREPPEKLNDTALRRGASEETIERGLLQIGKLRYGDGWDTAPRALHNLLTALNETVGVAASTRTEAIPLTLEEMTRFPLLYMHGRYRFRVGAAQQEALKDYISRGGVLFADACCGSSNFDQSFRALMKQMFPDQPMKEIPADHEIFSEAVGHSIKHVTRRRLATAEARATLTMRTETGPPLLEGIEIDGRYVVIYSRYDISCALEHQASLSCDGYVEDDAAKIAINVILYSMLQDIRWQSQ
jgi:hypothetical protein